MSYIIDVLIKILLDLLSLFLSWRRCREKRRLRLRADEEVVNVILNPKGEGSSKVVMRCHPALVMNLYKLNYLVIV